MKKIVLFIGIGFLFSCGDNETLQVGQKTTMEVQTVFDAGTVVKGEVINAKFKVTNTGEYPLVIGDVTPSCSCTVAEEPEDPIQPGESSEIIAQVKTDNLSSKKIQKMITVMANTEPSVTVLEIKGKIR
ncbi:MAG: DUF1573 domain-containing protein [Crocinitomicaceae bacterium]|nr:DUF1573 domain-containing protein [Crocinitomicaceae bacterium]MBP6032620.1 DUF1573 domain-containing protein [Crocinitomicaceae bacterium]